MNEIFSLQRFGALFVRYWVERKVAFLLYVLLAFVLLLWAFMSGHKELRIHQYENVTRFSVIIGYMAFMILMLSLVFKEFVDYKRGVWFMLIPASRNEKFAFLCVMGLMVPTVIYFGMLYFVDSFTFHQFYPESGYLLFVESCKVDKQAILTVIFYLFVIFLSYFMFKKHQLLYSMLVNILVFTYGFVLLDQFVAHQILHPQFWGTTPFGEIKVNAFSSLVDEGLIFGYPLYSIPVVVFFFVGMVYAANLKFREKQLTV
ncbi:hypothetical protein [Parabacteroides sp. FAFU027]|uniref:hypothetical protein n=1 Tax=Parabacteroides sp. FAFU027 TaxID=2922715 RepID=UPI001FAFD398|nr:hypothetical protein [Parabacteroides sp. FAFU027]